MFGSFQTSKYQSRLRPCHSALRGGVKASISAPHFAGSRGGEGSGLYQKGCGHGIQRQLARHETQFDEGLDVVFEQAVVDLIDIREVINRLALRILVVDAYVVVQRCRENECIESQ